MKRSRTNKYDDIIRHCILFAALVILVSCSPPESPEITTPNFIVIYTDDQRFDALGVSGNHVIQTPNIDRMAAQGVIFQNAHVAFSLCSPSRAALLTGRYGSRNGVLELNSSLNEEEITIAHHLKDHGYTTALSGKWHLALTPQKAGFDWYSYFHANGTYYGRRIINQTDTIYPAIHVDQYGVERSIEFLEEQSLNGRPFFLFHCPQTPHMNGQLIWDAQPATKQKYQVREMPVASNRLDSLRGKPAYLQKVRNRVVSKNYGYPDSVAIQQHTLEYYSVITELDAFLGRLFEKIAALDLLKNTYIIFMSDNGWMLGDHGFSSKVLPYEPSTHVPSWIVGPGIAPSTSEAMISNLDILPTILEWVGESAPKEVDGISLVGILQRKEQKVRDDFIYEGLGTYGGAKHNLTLINDRYRYIETYANERLDSVIYRELYDVSKDPLEMNNLAKEQTSQNMVRQLAERIEEFKSKE